MYIFLMVVQAMIGAALVAVILMQKSEGGGLAGGGSPAGLMSARGAADFMTRLTSILAALFVTLAIVLAAMAVSKSSGSKIDTSLQRTAPVDPLGQSAPAGVPAPTSALAPVAPVPGAPAPVAPATRKP